VEGQNPKCTSAKRSLRGVVAADEGNHSTTVPFGESRGARPGERDCLPRKERDTHKSASDRSKEAHHRKC